MTLAQQGSNLMKAFAKECPDAPAFNRAIGKWAARDLIESYGYDECLNAVKWYAHVAKKPEWTHFVREAGNCINEWNLAIQETKRRQKFRGIANEWRTK
jgi:hypothetical protein